MLTNNLTLRKARAMPAACVKEAVVNALEDGCPDFAYLAGWLNGGYHDPKTCRCGVSNGRA